jgi:hypothetical protein
MKLLQIGPAAGPRKGCTNSAALLHLVGVLVVCWLGGAAGAADAPTANASAPAAGDKTALAPPLYPPWAHNEQVWSDLTERQRVYVQKLGPPMTGADEVSCSLFYWLIAPFRALFEDRSPIQHR